MSNLRADVMPKVVKALDGVQQVSKILAACAVPGAGIVAVSAELLKNLFGESIKKQEKKETQSLSDQMSNLASLHDHQHAQLQGDVAALSQNIQAGFEQMETNFGLVIGTLKSVEKDLEKQREDVSHILDAVNELRQDGIGKVEAAFDVVMKGAHNMETTLEELKGFIFELNTENSQHLTVKKVREFRDIVRKNKGETKAEEFCHYILRVKAMYLLVISLYYTSRGDKQRVLTEYEDFHQQAIAIIKESGLADVYEGDEVDGKRHGKGTMFYKGGGWYKGDWLLGAQHGTGKKAWPTRDEYEGTFQNGARHGKGLMKWANHAVYDGEWKNDLMHGDGTLTGPDGDTFKGQFINDKKHGYGTYTPKTGKAFEGEWFNNEKLVKADKKIGNANTNVPQLADSTDMIKDFNQKAMEFIQGICNEDTYVGEKRPWPSHAKHGKGVLFCKDGSIYFGEWSNDKKHGKCRWKTPNGSTYDGDWEDDAINGKGNFTFRNGDTFSGQMLNGKRQGPGTYTFKNGDKYVGEFATNAANGQGKKKWASGETYVGAWQNDQMHGRGTMTNSAGQITEQGIWENDKFIG